jgi:hypothetical protein
MAVTARKCRWNDGALMPAIYVGLVFTSERDKVSRVTPAGEKFREILQELSGTRSLHHQCQK